MAEPDNQLVGQWAKHFLPRPEARLPAFHGCPSFIATVGEPLRDAILADLP